MTPTSWRLRLETLLAATSCALLLLTLVRKDWIEAVFGVDPDGGSGRLEWGLALTLAAVAVGSTALALADWRRARRRERPRRAEA